MRELKLISYAVGVACAFQRLESGVALAVLKGFRNALPGESKNEITNNFTKLVLSRLILQSEKNLINFLPGGVRQSVVRRLLVLVYLALYRGSGQVHLAEQDQKQRQRQERQESTAGRRRKHCSKICLPRVRICKLMDVSLFCPFVR